MQEGANKSDPPGSDFCNFVDGECPRCRADMDDKGHQIQEPRRGYHLDKGEIEYDWYMTLASMWDDPHQDFDLNLEH